MVQEIKEEENEQLKALEKEAMGDYCEACGGPCMLPDGIDVTDAFPPKPWQYRAWRKWCDEHGEGPWLYQFWGEPRGYFVSLTLESWMLGIESERPSDTEHWLTLRVGPFGFSLALWKAGS